jgi:neutral ceramidase
MSPIVGRAGIAAILCITGCGRLPSPVSPKPQAKYSTLHAGIARVDITPPPGAALFGYGAEGKAASGYRMRLYARALVFEDTRGERIAFVVTDLGANSVRLQRLVADRILDQTRIGADRLLLAATHTHAGPSHHFGLAHDFLSAELKSGGFDKSWTEELSDRIADAVHNASANMRPARVAVSNVAVWGVTHNRNPGPYSKNHPKWESPFALNGMKVGPGQDIIDPSWLMMRVDVEENGRFQPAAALSVFAMHATGSPSANRLYDADLHGMISQRIERAIDAMNARPLLPLPVAIHLFMQGSEGDVSAMPAETRCAAPTLKEEYKPEHGKPQIKTQFLLSDNYWDLPSDEANAKCIFASRARMHEVTEELTKRALHVFTSMQPTSDVTITRVFKVVYPGEHGDGFCEQARLGTAALGGVADGYTRVYGFEHIEEGGGAKDPGEGGNAHQRCHKPKRDLESLPQGLLYKTRLAPREAQFTALRLGDHILVTIPAEVTTTAGGRMKDAVAKAANTDRTKVSLIALVNGYLSYVASEEEYEEQHYEGSATIYGQQSARAIERILADMAHTLAGTQISPESKVIKAYAWNSNIRRRIPGANQGPPAVTRCIFKPTYSGGILYFDWLDTQPGRMLRAPFPILRIETRDGRTIAWDDHPALEIWQTPEEVGAARKWHGRLEIDNPSGDVRVVLYARDGMPEVDSERHLCS